MMPTSLGGLLFPAVAVVFLTLYVLALQAGVEPEIALLRAGLAAIALAGLGRASQWILTSAPVQPQLMAEAPRRLDVLLDESMDTSSAVQANGHESSNGFASLPNGTFGNNGQAGPGGKE